MKEVLVARSAGFCFGVSRSVKMAEQMLESGPCLSYGPLIHNADVVNSLAGRGLKVINSAEEVNPGDRVLIRSHGVSLAEEEALQARGAQITDATCPNVSRIHRLVAAASAAGRQVLVIGAAEHPEVRAICGRCEGAKVVANAQELEKLLSDSPEMHTKSVTVVVQTTQTEENLKECEILIKKWCTNPEIFDTICSATSTRQTEAIKLASECDAMVVIGGKNSANSLHLAELCERYCPNTQFVESAAALDLSSLKPAERIGVTAGASAPEWIIKEVLDKMSDEILIQENPAEETAAESAVEAAEPVTEAAVETAPAEEAVPTAAEAEAAEKPAAEKSFDELLEDSLKTIYNGDRVSGTVVAITPTEVSVDLGTKYSAFIPTAEFTNDGTVNVEDAVKIGDTVEAIVVRVNDIEGTAQLSKRRLDAAKSWQTIEQAQADGEIVEGVVTEENKGGVVVSVGGVRVFVPASQSGLPKDAPMTQLVKTTVRLKITEVNRSRRRVVGSIRAVLQKERREKAEAVWNEIEDGKVYHGVVKSLTSYGAFVDIGGIDGMVHVSELSWNRIKNPAEVVSVGQEIDVYVISFDREARRISLGYKRAEDNPWTKFINTCSVGDVVKVKIVKLMPFGAFAEVMEGVDGLIHISQIANRRIGKPDEVLSVGDVVDAKITAIDTDKQKISLSIRALSEPEPAPRRERRERSEREPREPRERRPIVPEEDALVYEVSETGEAKGNIPDFGFDDDEE
ncbi:MAG TPA: bifunctional 4-hydroxy-3-methylbut-2-enyl diphosphate reductase/30S ribosomal protein S1 [Candidatus Scatomorpha merdigallinarum]|nr:bifunctional 4-hydroxy-3-methylbut-2-enyl diphosphate reductase/30S ribosomal protein S1 [Candidatus Scatomorpha merdigallinarum]